jgi:AAA domain
MNSLKALNAKISNHEVMYGSLFISISIRLPRNQVQAIDIDESNLRMVRVGTPDRCDARLFSSHHWAVFKNVHNGIKACNVVFSTCSMAGSEVMKKAGNFDFIIIDEAGQVC